MSSKKNKQKLLTLLLKKYCVNMGKSKLYQRVENKKDNFKKC